MVHATVEYAATAWGGIASALELIVAAAAQTTQPTLVLTLGDAFEVASSAPHVRVCTVAMPELGAGGLLYRSPNLTNVQVQTYYGMYNYGIIGSKS